MTPQDWRRMAEEVEQSIKAELYPDERLDLIERVAAVLSTTAKTARDGALEEAWRLADASGYQEAANKIRKLKDKE